MTDRSDLELVELFRSGNTEGFNEIVRRYQERIYWTARRLVGSHDDADDVVQDVFIRAHGALKDFRGDSSLYTWLYRITTNLSLNALRKKRIKEFLNFDDVVGRLDEVEDHADTQLLRQEYQNLLEKAIDRLPARQKQVFVMRYNDELPYEEMAKMLHKSVGGLKASYFHALRKIQEFMRREMNQ